MNYNEFTKLTKTSDTCYVQVDVKDIVFNNEYMDIPGYENVFISSTLRDSLCRYVGMSPSINKDLYSTDKDLWYKVLNRLYTIHNMDNIILIIEESLIDKSLVVKNICGTNREPLLSHDFINRVISSFEDNHELEISDIQISSDKPISTITILDNSDPGTLDSKGRKYKCGVTFINDETYSTSCRLSIKYEDSDVYILPSKLYSLTSSRYLKNSIDSKESLEILMLRVKDDFDNGTIKYKNSQILSSILELHDKKVTYSEFSRLKTVILNACTSSDLSEVDTFSVIELLDSMNDYESIYGELDTNYIWGCTALSNYNFYDLLNLVDKLPLRYKFKPSSLIEFRDLLGEYLIVPRICQSLAVKV